LKSPLIISIISNLISYIIGIPLAFAVDSLIDIVGLFSDILGLIYLGFILFLFPVIANILIEGPIIIFTNVKSECEFSKTKKWGVISIANVITSLLLFLYIIKANY
jgi:hypothetical protein